jgi:hypothetical protein
MCFSATASFTAGVVLVGIGTLTLKSAKCAREYPFAAIPLLFGIQQLIEGVIWLTFTTNLALLNLLATHLYSFFSHVLWPVYLPMAVLMIEPNDGHKRSLAGLAMVGFAVATYLLFILLAYPVVSHPIGQHIEYDSPHFFGAWVMLMYLIATIASPLLSSHAWVRVYGALALMSFSAVYYYYTTWFISIWCFFAALLSIVIYAHFSRLNVRHSHTKSIPLNLSENDAAAKKWTI